MNDNKSYEEALRIKISKILGMHPPTSYFEAECKKCGHRHTYSIEKNPVIMNPVNEIVNLMMSHKNWIAANIKPEEIYTAQQLDEAGTRIATKE
jgi:hypothetical protein